MNCTMRSPMAGLSNPSRPSRFEVIPNLKDFTFSEGGPKAWFVAVRRDSN